ncbi:cytoplasmic protein [Rhodoferax sp.]|uniref:cytoplasmic protein n=1 Tax=Rhodoferax sp. TaxID=50421 RepID=UPI0026132F78|nr:cytoplasmic protein [Rhodoferax sp.]MDD3938032.1 cytoplasmic protein [Rhodoferax sp.]
MDPLHQAIDHDRAEREFLRWVILLALWHARPYGCSEHVIMGACRDIPIRVTFDQVRQEIHSLGKRGLVDVKNDAPIWSAELSASGEAVVDYRADCPSDIARPNRW